MSKKTKPARRGKPVKPEPVPSTAPAEPAAAVPAAIAMPVPPPTARLPDRYRAVLLSNQRGTIQARRAPTWHGVFAEARQLLHEAEGREWMHGEVVSISIEPAAD